MVYLGNKIVIAIVICIFSVAMIAVNAHAATITVCSAGYGTCDYSSIQDAINHASEGDQINVTGTFNENVTVNVSVDLSSNETLESNITGFMHILSNNTNISRFNVTGNTDINCQGLATVICIESNVSVTLNYLNVSGSSSVGDQYNGIYIYYSNLTTLFRNRITNISTDASTAARAIHIQGSKHINVLGNNITIGTAGRSPVYYPIYLESGGVENVNITSNYFTTSNASVSLGGVLYFGLDVSDIIFENNNVTKMKEDPLFLFGTNTRTNNTTIVGNRFYDNGANQGTCLSIGGFNISFYNNILANNTCTDEFLLINQPNTAPINTTILNNTFYNGSSTAIRFDGSVVGSGFNVTNISGNNITNFITGIVINTGNLTLYKNNISSNRYGINISSTASSFIFDNYFNNTENNAKDNGNTQVWNDTKHIGTNIMGGANIAGNFWSDYNGVDTDGDGLGDTNLPYNSSGNISTGGDYAPLVAAAAGAANSLPSITITAPQNNSVLISQYPNITVRIIDNEQATTYVEIFANNSNKSYALVQNNTLTNLTWGQTADGIYTYYARAYDNSSNNVSEANLTITIDTTPPSSVTNLRDTANSTTGILWNWTNPNDADFNHAEIYLNATFKTNTSSEFYNATGLNANTGYEIQTRTVDNLGNIGSWANDTAFTLALQQESSSSVSISSPLNNTKQKTNSVDVVFIITDNENATTQATLYFNGTNKSYNGNVQNNTQTTFTVSELADGNWTFWINVTDGANNSKSGRYDISIDTTPPQNITNLNETSKTINSITWNWTNPSDSDLNHIEVYLNKSFKENTSSNSYQATSLSANTIYELELRPVDNLGNIGTWTNDTAQTMDQVNTLPSIQIISPANNTETNDNTPPITFKFIDAENTTAQATLYFNGTNKSYNGAVANNTNTILTASALSDGNWTFWINVTDGAGENTSLRFDIGIDSTTPTITIVTPTDTNTSVSRNWTYYNITLDEAVNSANVEVNGTNYTLTQGTTNKEWYKNFTNQNVGNYTYRFFANDTFGNTGFTGFSWVNISWGPTDTTPPAEISNLNESTKTVNSITWNWTNPSDSDFNHVEIYLNATFKTNTTLNSYQAASLNASTTYELELRPVDNVGNIGNWTNDTAQTDADSVTPPVIGTAGGGGGGGGAGPALPQESTSIGNLGAGESKIITFQNSESHYVNTISLTAKSEVKNGNVRVTRYYTRPGAVSDISDSVFTYISIEPINFKTEDISTAEITFFANKSFVDKNSGKEIVLLHYNGKSWEDLATIKTGAYDDKLTYKAKTPGFSFFAISVREKAKQAQLAAPETLVPAETETVQTSPVVQESSLPMAHSPTPTGLLLFDRIKNPYSLAVIGGLLVAGLAGYTLYSGKVKLPQISVRKIEKPKFEFLQKLKGVRLPNFSLPKLPKVKIEPKAQSPPPIAKKIELPKFSLPKFSLPQISLPKIRVEKRTQSLVPNPQSPTPKNDIQKQIIVQPKIFVKSPEIDYKKLAKELRPAVEPKKEIPKAEKKAEESAFIPQPAFPSLAKPQVAQPLEVNTHMKSVLAALHEREREVMETLILHSGRTTMARVFHHTGMPPTTLFRWIVSLENRGLIKSTKIGKLRRIEVTQKFLKGE